MSERVPLTGDALVQGLAAAAHALPETSREAWACRDAIAAIARLEARCEALEGENRFLHERRGDLVIERDKAREALTAALEAINPPDLGGISLATWNDRLKAVTAVIREALAYDNRKARAALTRAEG